MTKNTQRYLELRTEMHNIWEDLSEAEIEVIRKVADDEFNAKVAKRRAEDALRTQQEIAAFKAKRVASEEAAEVNRQRLRRPRPLPQVPGSEDPS